MKSLNNSLFLITFGIMIDINEMLLRKPRHEKEYKIAGNCFEEAQGCGTVREVADLMVEHFKELYPNASNMVKTRFLDLEVEEVVRGSAVLERVLEAIKTNNRALLWTYIEKLLVLEIRDGDCPKHDGLYNGNIYGRVYSGGYASFFCPKAVEPGSLKNIVYKGEKRPVCTSFGRRGIGIIFK